MEQKRVVVYLNQFFGQIGGEDKADTPPQSTDKPVGPAVGLSALLPKNCTIVRTIICGDGYFNENLEEASAAVRQMLKLSRCGRGWPSQQRGRYGGLRHLGRSLLAGIRLYPVCTETRGRNVQAVSVHHRSRRSAASMHTALPAMASSPASSPMASP